MTYSPQSDHVAARLAKIRGRIAAAARRAGRDPDEVTLITVTKTRPAATVAPLGDIVAGVVDLGENRVQEASAKIAELGHTPWRWHLLGSLQSNKAAQAVRLFDYIHSVDSLKLARRLDHVRAHTPDRAPVPVLLQINIAGEASKSGFDLRGVDDPEGWSRFLTDVRQIVQLPGLRPSGLMTIAPEVSDPEQVRSVFSALARMRDALREQAPECDWPELSMGMSNDFEVAIEEGATMVRIGRAILGAR